MSIRWDPLLARHVARELRSELAGARLRALRLDGSSRDLVLLFRDRTLLWRLHPRLGYLSVRERLEPVAGDVKLKATVEDVRAPPDERRIRFTLAGGASPHAIVVELMGNQWNALVVEGKGASPVIRHVLWRREGARNQSVGQEYRPPAAPLRQGTNESIAIEAWLGVLAPLPPGERRAALIHNFAWTSPLNADTLLGPAGESELEAGYALWRLMVDEGTPSEPVVLELPSGTQPYPFPLLGVEQHPARSLLAAFDECGAEAATMPEASAAAALGPALVGQLKGEVRRARRRMARLEAELAELEDPAALRAVGDLILARYADIPAGASHARLRDFDGGEMDVELDPSWPPHQNASAYYRRATKAERGAERLPPLIEKARFHRERLEKLLAGARSGTAEESQILDALGPRRASPATPAGQGPSLPYRAFQSSGGLEIRVGRGARHNDELTFHHSSPGDVWLHARHSAGAHVILRWPGPGNPPARDLQEAATLAALHSKARTSGSVPVDWTLRKYVRKPRKAPPGRVSIDRAQTLFVEPDPALLESLATSERR